jgi:hypothetical protein
MPKIANEPRPRTPTPAKTIGSVREGPGGGSAAPKENETGRLCSPSPMTTCRSSGGEPGPTTRTVCGPGSTASASPSSRSAAGAPSISTRASTTSSPVEVSRAETTSEGKLASTSATQVPQSAPDEIGAARRGAGEQGGLRLTELPGAAEGLRLLVLGDAPPGLLRVLGVERGRGRDRRDDQGEAEAVSFFVVVVTRGSFRARARESRRAACPSLGRRVRPAARVRPDSVSVARRASRRSGSRR